MDNIFTALVRRRTTGVVMEFVLWCIVCFAALLSLIALAMGAGNFVWILLLLTAAGLGVIMAFRLREVALLYSVCVFNAILFLIHYLVFSVSYGGGPQTAFSFSLCSGCPVTAACCRVTVARILRIKLYIVHTSCSTVCLKRIDVIAALAVSVHLRTVVDDRFTVACDRSIQLIAFHFCFWSFIRFLHIHSPSRMSVSL